MKHIPRPKTIVYDHTKYSGVVDEPLLTKKIDDLHLNVELGFNEGRLNPKLVCSLKTKTEQIDDRLYLHIIVFHSGNNVFQRVYYTLFYVIDCTRKHDTPYDFSGGFVFDVHGTIRGEFTRNNQNKRKYTFQEEEKLTILIKERITHFIRDIETNKSIYGLDGIRYEDRR